MKGESGLFLVFATYTNPIEQQFYIIYLTEKRIDLALLIKW